MDELKIHELSLQFPHDKEMLIRFLNRNGLVFEEDIEAAYGIFTPEDELAGCGCCAGNLLKCFAVDESLRGQNALGSLISRLTENRFAAGYYDLFVITRPENRVLFTSCGFYPLAETQSVLMLENKKNGLDSYYKKFEADGARLKSGAMNDGVGCIVMNCNPFTKGHQELITYAASKCSLLHIFVVEENRSMFPFADRFRLVREGTDHIPNVLVHPSGPYMISNATFPTYFLKKGEDAARIQSELDITLFASRIAPLLHITKRFAGEEPFDPVTRSYNETMVRLLPQYGISFIRIARFTTGGPQDEIISASRVRKLLMEEGVTEKLLSFVPPCTAEYLKKNQALWKKTAEQEAIRGGDGHEAI